MDSDTLEFELSVALEEVMLLKLLLTAKKEPDILFLVNTTNNYWLGRLDSVFGGGIPTTNLRLQVASSDRKNWYTDELPISIKSNPHCPKGINYWNDPIIKAFPETKVDVDGFNVDGVNLTPNWKTVQDVDADTQEGYVPVMGRWYTFREHPAKVPKAGEKSGNNGHQTVNSAV